MTGEEFAWNMLRKGLRLTDEDIEELRAGVLELKDMGPQLKRRAELTEMRVHALCIYLKKKDPEGWKEAERESIEHFRRGA